MAAELDIQESKAVTVSNISPSANEKTVSDFFSFCGKINKLFLNKTENADTSVAVVQFETESAAKTALLLTNALIIDRPITVVPYSTGQEKEKPAESTPNANPVVTATTEVPADHITQRDFGVPDDQRSKTSVVASLLAAGYVLGQDVLVAAKEVDEKNMISLQAKVAVASVTAKLHEFDVSYGISEKASNIQKQATEKVKQLDEQYKISEMAKEVGNKITTTTTTAVNKVLSQPTVASTVSVVKEKAGNVKNSVSTTFSELETETKKQIEEKQKEKVGGKPDEAGTVTTTPQIEAPKQPEAQTQEEAKPVTETKQ